MKQAFTSKRWTEAHLEILRSATAIINQYQDGGYDLTLRQLYYQFIALNLFPDDWLVSLKDGQQTKNHERNYKKLGNIINDGRMCGLVDWDAIVDRTRNLQTWYHEKDVPNALERMKNRYTLDFWNNQEVRVEVWVEKEALAGVFSRICGRWDVPYFACRGYTSASASYEAYKRIENRLYKDQRTVILHFGDHDPSGIDMTRDNRDRLELMIHSHYHSGEGSDFLDAFEVRRMALNWDQITEFNPPPSPAKVTDSRAEKYIEEFGEDSWELDALNPDKLTSLAEEEIKSLIDFDKWEETTKQIAKDKKVIDKLISQSKKSK